MMTHEDVLATVAAARERTRRAKRAGWIPLLVFGILVLPALSFHLQSAVEIVTDPSGHLLTAQTRRYGNHDGGLGLFWYWQVAIPSGYLLVAALYALRNRRAGVRTPVRSYVVTGIVLVVAVFYFENAAMGRLGWGDLGIHGLDATITVGLALFVLAWIERSMTLAAAAAVVTAAALTASLYDIENLWSALFGLSVPSGLAAATNDLAVSATLLLCAALVGVVDHRRVRTGRTA